MISGGGEMGVNGRVSSFDDTETPLAWCPVRTHVHAGGNPRWLRQKAHLFPIVSRLGAGSLRDAPPGTHPAITRPSP